MSRTIIAQPLTSEAFGPFGDVIDKDMRHERIPINGGHARRLAPLARAVTLGPDGSVVITLVEADPYTSPLRLDLVERHPLGSQAFIPLSQAPFLVIVCPDQDGTPGTPQAYVTAPHQGINYHPGVWHGVLTPLGSRQDFIVVDRGGGGGGNLEEYRFSTPWIVQVEPSASG